MPTTEAALNSVSIFVMAAEDPCQYEARRSRLHFHSGRLPLLAGFAVWKSTSLGVWRPEIFWLCFWLAVWLWVRFFPLWALCTLIYEIKSLYRWDYNQGPRKKTLCFTWGCSVDEGMEEQETEGNLHLMWIFFPITLFNSPKESANWANIPYTVEVASSPTDGLSGLLFHFLVFLLRGSSSSTGS